MQFDSLNGNLWSLRGLSKNLDKVLFKDKSLYKVMLMRVRASKIMPPVSSSKLYSSIMQGFANFFAHCKDIGSLIVKKGTAVTITDSALKRRKTLGLPPPKFDEADVKRLAITTGLSKILEESR